MHIDTENDLLLAHWHNATVNYNILYQIYTDVMYSKFIPFHKILLCFGMENLIKFFLNKTRCSILHQSGSLCI